MKSAKRRMGHVDWRKVFCASLAYPSLYAVRALLGIHASPLNPLEGWKPFIGWMIVFMAFLSLYHRSGKLLCRLWPNSAHRNPARLAALTELDLYLLAQAEMRADAERRAEWLHAQANTTTSSSPA